MTADSVDRPYPDTPREDVPAGYVLRSSDTLAHAMVSEYEATLREIEILQAYARSAGKVIPDITQKKLAQLVTRTMRGEDVSEDQVTLALSVHTELSIAVAPATVRTIQCTDPDQPWGRWLRRFWVIPLIFTITILALAVMILFGSSSADAATAQAVAAGEQPASTTGASAAGVAKTAQAAKGMLGEQLHYLVAAVLGAGFYSLFTAYGYISSRTFDPAYNNVYLIRFLLGVVSGAILANFGPSIGLKGFQTTLLGLIGGYSAEAVNQILIRVGETLVAAVKGNGKDDLKAREAELRTEAREQQARQRQHAAMELAEVLKVAVDGKAPTDVINRVKVAMDALGR